MKHVEQCMGTVFTIEIRDAGEWDEAVADVVAWLHRVDAVFSTYRPASDVSRMQRGELSLADADPLVAEVLGLCADVQLETDGFFTAIRSGRIDPTGLVKGWAVERAGALLTAHGAVNHGVNGGGDMQLAGSSAPGQPWRVGIADPHDRTRVLAVVTGRDFAVASSGTAERGAHLVDPSTGRPAAGWASATVVGASLTRADAYATAAFVRGGPAVEWGDGYTSLLVAADGTLEHSPRWAAAA